MQKSQQHFTIELQNPISSPQLPFLHDLNEYPSLNTNQSPQIINIPKYQGKTHQTLGYSLYCGRRGKHGVNSAENYASNLTHVYTFQTLQQFFILYRNIRLPSQCQIDTKILLFKKQCKPYWEDWLNSGSLLLQFKNQSFKSQNNQKNQQLDNVWEYLIFSLVGNSIHNDVIGICLCKREKITLIEIWLNKQDNAYKIGVTLENSIKKQIYFFDVKNNEGKSQINNPINIKYKKHRDSINTQSTMKGAHQIKITHKGIQNKEQNIQQKKQERKYERENQKNI